MKELVKGHSYQLDCLDDFGLDIKEHLTFVQRVGNKYPGNKIAHPGTITQEVCRMLIARHTYLLWQSEQISDEYGKKVNYYIILQQRRTIYGCEWRAAKRHNRKLNLTKEEFKIIEQLPTCKKCGHIKSETHTECNASI